MEGDAAREAHKVLLYGGKTLCVKPFSPLSEHDLLLCLLCVLAAVANGSPGLPPHMFD
jgi:hypothetical protein